MNYISLEAAKKIYDCAKSCKIHWHNIEHNKFKEFCLDISKFDRLVAEIDDFPLKDFIRLLRRYRFKLSAAPVEFNNPAVISSNMIDKLSGYIKEFELTYPSIANEASTLFEKITNIASTSENPLLDYITSNFNSDKDTALLIKDSSLILPAEVIFSRYKNLQNLHLLRPHQMRGGACYNQLIVAGPSLWFPSFIFDSPRAYEIHILKYQWVKDSCKTESAFLESSIPKVASRGRKSFKENISLENVVLENSINSEELLYSIDWDNFSVDFTSTGGKSSSYEHARARLFLLEKEYAVFLEVSENSKALVIDIEEDENEEEEQESRVKRINVNDIQEEMFLLLRAGGGGDYIVPVADQILGDKAVQARKSQERWKQLLRKIVKRRGIQEVCLALKSLGSPRASETNARNWMSSKSIKPADYQDFLAIMRLIRLEKEASKYWKIAQAIEHAHRRAGYYIRNELLNKVMHTDLSNLERTGKMDFYLEQAGGGALTAIRVEGKSPGFYEVPISRLGVYFERDV
ncbi:MAG: hypothetical protein K9L17_06805 [Clostridiales bacterium]|nr:hypothetical protein [Clostridiales bacterium]MCF8022380.1 hypothetical protein [Clostridiales bacterium]